MSKQTLWERRLLDLSLRNNLIHLRPTKNLLPILSTDLEELEDSLSGGSAFKLSAGFNIVGRKYPDDLDLSNLHMLESYKELLESRKELYTPLNDLALIDAVRTLYRSSKLSIEENGANTLYLALGLLQWIDPKTPDKMRYAPLILLPVEMVRRSFIEGYTIRQRDDEIMINTTLLEMLKQDFGIKIEGLDPIPTDDDGIKVEEVFSIIQNAVSAQKDWEILRSAYLGIFSFSQFVMWNDLRSRADDLAKNKIVKSLMDGKLAWDAESMEIGDRVPPDTAFLPIPADASQLFAIQSATEDKSFVLHGPPGTGKSQTITGIIANAIAQGKTVLFVAEKMAALSVVQKRMEKLGLGDFCLELHSNKARKRDVLHQLMSATENISAHDPRDYAKMAEEVAKLRSELDAYAQSLHQKRSSNFSFFEMLMMYEEHKDRAEIKLKDQYIENITKEKFAQDLKVIGELRALAESLGDVGKDPLCLIALQNYDLSYDYRTNIPPLARSYQIAGEKLLAVSQPLIESLEESSDGIYTEKELREIVDALEIRKDLPSSWTAIADPQKVDDLLHKILTMASHGEKMQSVRKNLLPRWNESFFTQNVSDLRSQWKEVQEKGMILGFFAKNKFLHQLSSFAKQKPDPSQLTEDLAQLADYQNERAAFESIDSGMLGELDKGEETDWTNVATLANNAIRSNFVLQHLCRSADPKTRYQAICDGGFNTTLFFDALHRFEEAHQAISAVIPLKIFTEKGYLPTQIEFAKAIQHKTDYIREWTQFNKKIQELADLGVDDFEDEAYRLRPNDFQVAYYKTVSRLLTIKTLHEDPVLANFSGATFDEKIARFKDARRQLEDLTKKEIFYRLASRVPNFTKEASKSSELGILQKAIRSNGRGLSIRRLFQQIPTILPRLAPCMLMSPISCAQYLDIQHKFDLVIFDEASQLPTSKAVGVLARGTEAIIVGDPKQMPPTSFFSGENLDEENIEQEDLESILEDCLALSMPQTHLLWHYRSRHESLISFSNHKFYESKLYTFPSVDDRAKMVRFIPSGGIFDRGGSRTNPIEAQMIVDEVIRRAKDPSLKTQSLGIVTFNIAQQSLIEDLLEKAYANDHELDILLNQSEEPIFVKNLENVQGDERDVILFSIGFGPDKEGRVYMNFGPLNQEGGWRRLNVAITRSRLEMQVFSSLEPEDIDLSKTQAQGVQALKEFLAYAKSGATQTTKEEDPKLLGIGDRLCGFLRSQGYKIATQVGRSKFKIDIAVLDPRDEEKYLLGIMLDGDSYRMSRTTEDRETSPFNVLRGLGWNIHRIWSVDYYQNPQKQHEKLLDHLEILMLGQKDQPLGPQNIENIGESGSTDQTAQDPQHSPDPMDPSDDIKRSDDPIEKVFPSIESDPSDEKEIPPAPPLNMTQRKIEEIRQRKAQEAMQKEKIEPIESSIEEKKEIEKERISAEQRSDETGNAQATISPKDLPIDLRIIEQPYQSAELKEKKMTSSTFSSAKNQSLLMEYIAQIIEVEGPICEDALYRKILKTFGISRTGEEVQSTFLRALHLVKPKTSLHNGIPFFWQRDQDPEQYPIVRRTTKEEKREIDHIHPKELQNAILLVLEEQIALPRDELIKEASKKLGYARLTNAIAEHLKKELEKLIVNDRIEEHQQMMRCKE
ncbi:MAG: DUF3320 domain-containing protein [Peptostreptococcaceae bacterium]|nr:DUF3320 domain-containing protein [Peptostreptococcaceae bacterium]